MPIGSNPPVRAAGRPPWVRDGPKPIPVPAAPWTLNRRGQQQQGEDGQTSQAAAQPSQTTPRKTTQITIQPAENGAPKQAKLQSREVKVPIVTEKPATKITTSVRKKSNDEPPPAAKKVEATPEPPKPKVESKIRTQNRQIQDKEEARETLEKVIPVQRVKSLAKQDSIKGPPIGPPLPPPPPPPPPNAPPPEFKKKPITEQQAKRLQALRSRPRKRPDWTDMMKEVESGRKLKHVECNDRSGPILSKSMLFKAKGSFVYESEKDNVHNKLLKQIQFGVPLKKVKCNDRSKPILDGLRKFRRQMTIEEQIQKSQSQANLSEPPVEEDEVDEMDDIDKVRDDLQSTKQLLALELRNKEAQVRENKRLLARIQNLEAELELERARVAPQEVKTAGSAPDETLIKALKNEASAARKHAEDLETKYQKAAEMLDNAKSNLEEQKKQNALLEKKLQQALQGCQRLIKEEIPKRRVYDFEPDSDMDSKNDTRRASEAPNAQEPEEEEEEVISETESDSDDDEETRKEKAAKRLQREIKMLSTKLRNYKDKQVVAKKERKALKDCFKKQQVALKEEKKKYKELQKEVDKMAALMKDASDDEEEESSEEEEPEEEESEEESSESEESESESESESEDEDATDEQKKKMLETRAKRHEGILNALKKGNYLLKANVDRQRDDLNKQREMSITLQEDLNSVLSELG